MVFFTKKIQAVTLLVTLFFSAQAAVPKRIKRFFRWVHRDSPSLVALYHTLKDNPDFYDAKNEDGQSALLYAAAQGKILTTLRLCYLGFDINDQDPQGNTALMLAASNGATNTTRDLIYYCHKLKKDMHNNAGQTAVDIARAGNHVATVNMINRCSYQGHHRPCLQGEIRALENYLEAARALAEFANQ